MIEAAIFGDGITKEIRLMRDSLCLTYRTGLDEIVDGAFIEACPEHHVNCPGRHPADGRRLYSDKLAITGVRAGRPGRRPAYHDTPPPLSP